MKKLILAAILILCSLDVSAQTQTHTVARGESLKSIAGKYQITTGQLVDANPGVENLFYVGLILNIPEAGNMQTQTQSSVNTTSQIPITESPSPAVPIADTTLTDGNASGYDPQDFSNVYLQYFSDPEFFDKGCYGIGFVTYGANGFGGTISAHGNWGIVDNGQLMFKFGPAYGYAVTPNFMINASLRGFIYTYDELNGKNETSTDQKVNGGITLTPGITLRFEKVMLSAGFELGWENNNNKIYKCIEIGLGYNF